MHKQESHVSEVGLGHLITRKDLDAAHRLASSLLMEKSRTRFAAFTGSHVLQLWSKEKGEEIARLLHIGSSDSINAEVAIKEIAEITILEAFLVAFTFVSKLNGANAVDDSGAIQPEDLLKLELWERGLLSKNHYKFEVKGDAYLARVKKNHTDVTRLLDKVKKMKSIAGDSNEK